MLMREYEAATERIAHQRRDLTDAIHRRIPQSERFVRRELLALKRALFSGRDLALMARPGELVPPDIAHPSVELSAFAAALEALVAERIPQILEEIREAVVHALDDREFRLAIAAASPDLAADLTPAKLHTEEVFAVARGVSTYAARFFSKANPFHAFARIDPSVRGDVPATSGYEIVLDHVHLRDLERRVVEWAGLRPDLFVAIAPHQVGNDHYQFWVHKGGGLAIVRLRSSAALDALVTWFADSHRLGSPCARLHEISTYLATQAEEASSDAISNWLLRLSDLGVLTLYGISDFDRFAEELSELANNHADLSDEVHFLGSVHRTIVDLDGLEAATRRLSSPSRSGANQGPIPFRVNALFEAEASRYHEAAAEVASDLRRLAPLFAVEHNFSATRRRMAAFYRSRLAARQGARSPFLDLMAEYLAEEGNALRVPPESLEMMSLRERCASLHGSIDESQLEDLLLRIAPVETTDRPSLCFNGPFDAVKRRYFVSNVFAGDGRFVSRYLVRQRTSRPARSAQSADLEVEVALPPWPDLNAVTPGCAIGCGFETRFAHRYAEWISPAAIEVALEAGTLVYRHRGSNRRLRLRYRGCLLSEFLPIEVQLLLLDQADAFHNPFLASDVPLAQETLEISEVRFRQVVVRRRELRVRASAILGDGTRHRNQGGDLVRDALRLRERIRSILPEEFAELWFYRLLNGRGRLAKPRFLDLASPLSSEAFHRFLGRSSAVDTVCLSPLDPPIENCFVEHGQPWATELMIEV